MKISWIFPHTNRCGISIYSNNYCKALQSRVDLQVFNTSEFIRNSTQMIRELNKADLVHIQYEPSLFFHGKECFYHKLVTRIAKPVIVSLHEVYDEDPRSFSRSQIKGFFRAIRLLIYDLRHPFQTAFRKHVYNNFYASLILVHHNYQADILTQLGIIKNRIHVFNHPVKIHYNDNGPAYSGKTLRVGMTGFINPDYNYKLLFTLLEKINLKWEFVWIGGIRTSEQQYLYQDILNTISVKGWQDRFHITGWVSEQEQTRLIAGLDCALALFKNRSSSDSVPCILGALKPVISTSLPLFYDINKSFNQITNDSSPLIIINDDPDEIVNNLLNLKFDNQIRTEKLEQIKKYIHYFSFENMAGKLLIFYQSIFDR